MLCRRIVDTVESGHGEVAGLGLLDADIVFGEHKTLRRWQHPLSGYEIHHGQLVRCDESAWFQVDSQPHGIVGGAIYGTHWHGLLDNDEFRRGWLTRVAAAARRRRFVVADDTNVAARRDAQLDLMADLMASHLEVDAILGLLDGAGPPRPHIASQLRR
ncbi:hypothetical protein ATCCBAA256_13420 [Mycobacterium montefiorense]|nr:hypothetical protein ATCCBAA256_13420 [Mycobacterium montefiorense]